ncbi:MAG: NAD+ synthase [Candidatus Bathyarchaeota archaeon]|nr:NAD+ synthase [Candidatus Bathyarchaeota archaeon]
MGLTKDLLQLDFSLVKQKITKFIVKHVKKAGAEGVVIGLSGGLDSSTVAVLCVSALGADKVLGLIMPSTTTSQQDTEDAKLLAENLGIKHEVIDISPVEDRFLTLCSHQDLSNKVAVGNIKPRIRMAILYYHANLLNRLVVGTGNKTEILVGYYTKYGDGGVDIQPLGGLYKTQVRWLAEYMKLPSHIIWKTPTAGLWIGQTDEEELGIKYDLLDLILYGLVDLKMKPQKVAESLGIQVETVNKVLGMMKKSEHKRRKIPVANIK